MASNRRSYDLKVRILYLVLAAALVVFGWPITVALDQAHGNCVDGKIAAHKFNGALDTILANSLSSSTLTPAEKQKRIEQYVPLHIYEPRACPGVWPWEH